MCPLLAGELKSQVSSQCWPLAYPTAFQLCSHNMLGPLSLWVPEQLCGAEQPYPQEITLLIKQLGFESC